jgi:hypothetical protein
VAIYHLSVKTVSRSSGRSATAAAAYRAGVEIVDQRTGQVHDYTRRSGVVSAEITLPADAPAWAGDRSALWNAAEQSETRKNSTVAREFEIALPDELNEDQRRQLVGTFAKELADRHGIAVDAAIHEPDREGDKRNHHAHVLTTTRRLGPDGFGEKARELDDRKTGPELVGTWRERWGELTNEALERAGRAERVDHRSLGAQREEALERGDQVQADGLDRAPGIKLGPVPTMDLRRAGGVRAELKTDRATQWMDVRSDNRTRQRLLEKVRGAVAEGLQRGLEWAGKVVDSVNDRLMAWADSRREKELEQQREQRRQEVQRIRGGRGGVSRWGDEAELER